MLLLLLLSKTKSWRICLKKFIEHFGMVKFESNIINGIYIHKKIIFELFFFVLWLWLDNKSIRWYINPHEMYQLYIENRIFKKKGKSLHIHIVNAIWIDSICGKRDSIEKPFIFHFSALCCLAKTLVDHYHDSNFVTFHSSALFFLLSFIPSFMDYSYLCFGWCHLFSPNEKLQRKC